MGAVAWSIAEPANVERRRHQRVKVRLAGRFMRSDRMEFDCESIDASPGGIAVSSDAAVERGERIVAYLNQIGRIEGKVARTFAGGFAGPDEFAGGQARQAGRPTDVARQPPLARDARGPAP